MNVLNELGDGPVVRAQEIQVLFLLQVSCVGSEKCPRSPAGVRQSWHSTGVASVKATVKINGKCLFL